MVLGDSVGIGVGAMVGIGVAIVGDGVGAGVGGTCGATVGISDTVGTPVGEEVGMDVGGVDTLHLSTFPPTSPKYKKAPSALCENSAKMGELDAKASQFWIPVATS